MTKFRCSQCGQKIAVPDPFVGHYVRCPRCHAAVRVAGPAPRRPGEPADPSPDRPGYVHPALRSQGDSGSWVACPTCGSKVHLVNAWAEVLCRQCGAVVTRSAKSLG